MIRFFFLFSLEDRDHLLGVQPEFQRLINAVQNRVIWPKHSVEFLWPCGLNRMVKIGIDMPSYHDPFCTNRLFWESVFSQTMARIFHLGIGNSRRRIGFIRSSFKANSVIIPLSSNVASHYKIYVRSLSPFEPSAFVSPGE
jgi:hypothetical protein